MVIAMSVATKKHPEQHQWGVWIWIKWKPGAPKDAWKPWKDIEQIEEAWSMTGEWDCALWISSHDPEEIERLVWKEIRGNKWVEDTDTHWGKKYW